MILKRKKTNITKPLVSTVSSNNYNPPNVIYTHQVKEEIEYRNIDNNNSIPVNKATKFQYTKEKEDVKEEHKPFSPSSLPPSSPVPSSKLEIRQSSPVQDQSFNILAKMSLLAEKESEKSKIESDTGEIDNKPKNKPIRPIIQENKEILTQTIITHTDSNTRDKIQEYENVEQMEPNREDYEIELNHSSNRDSENNYSDKPDKTYQNIESVYPNSQDSTQKLKEFAEQKNEEPSKNVKLEPLDSNTVKGALKEFHIQRDPEYFGFGIILHTDKEKDVEENFIYPKLEIEQNSPADVAGLKTDQRLIAVNGKYINKDFKTITSLAQGIDDSYYQKGYTDFTVIDANIWDEIKDNETLVNVLNNKNKIEQQISENNQNTEAKTEVALYTDDKTIPRFCRLLRETREDQYGFDFKTLKSEGKHIATNVRDGFPAKKAGLRNGDYILEVNGKSIDSVEHEAVVNLIFSNFKQVDLLVVEDIKGYKKSRKQQEKLSQEILKKLDPTKPKPYDQVIPPIDQSKLDDDNVTRHNVTLIPTYKGIGLHLNFNGAINYIEPLSPAEFSGLQKDQVIVEVNGENVRGKSNREIAKLIKEHAHELIIGVETPTQTINELNVEKPIDPPSNNEENSTIGKLIQTQVPTSPPKVRAVDENIFMQSKALSDTELNNAQQSPILSSSISSKTGKQIADDLTTIRVCNLISRPDFVGYGFELKKNETGPHQIVNVEENSPAMMGGLKKDDYLLKVNDTPVVGERYSKTVARIKNESEKGRVRLEVIEPDMCPKELKDTRINMSSGHTTVSSVGKLSPIMSSSVKDKKKVNKDASNLKSIVQDIENSTPDFGSVRSVPEYTMNVPSNNGKRSVTGSPTLNSSGKQMRPFSMNDLGTIDPKVSVRSVDAKSFGSTTTGFSAEALNAMNMSGNIISGSVRSTTTPFSVSNLPKFKRCTIVTSPHYKGFGFVINSKVKPKLMIFEVDADSPAELAGVRKYDVLIEINTKNVRRTSFDKVRAILEQALKSGRVELLLISKEGYIWYKQRKNRFSKKLATENNIELFSNFNTLQEQNVSSPMGSGERFNEGLNLNTSSSVLANRGNLDLSKSSPPISLKNKRNSEIDNRTNNNDILHFTVKRREDYKGLGITLSTSKTKSNAEEKILVPVITNIEEESPADVAGLKKFDQILEINGKSTYKQPNEFISNSIRNSGNEVQFIVSREQNEYQNENVDPETMRLKLLASLKDSSFDEEASQASERSQNLKRKESLNERRSRSASPTIINSAMTLSSSKIHTNSPNEIRQRNSSEPPAFSESRTRDTPVPRLCRVRTYESNLGFQVTGSKFNPGIFKVTDIVNNSPAQHSGLRNEDYIIEISGTNVESMTYEEVINLIKMKKDQDDLQMLVVDKYTLEWYKKQDLLISSRQVPKLTYIETLLQEEMQYNLTDMSNATHKISQESLDALQHEANS